MNFHCFHCFLFIFLWVYVLQSICCVDPEQSSNISTSGPFNISLKSINDCNKPTKPYVKNPPIVFNTVIDRNSSLSGNVTVTKDVKYLKMRVRGYIQNNGKWVSSYIFKQLDCHGVVQQFICTTMSVKYDRKNCVYSKGTYAFENVDINLILHYFLSNVKYGRILWRAETFVQAGTYTCKEVDTVIEPA